MLLRTCSLVPFISVFPVADGLLFNSFFKQKIQENEILDELFADLDQNGDLEIDFKEFVALIAMVTSACHEFFSQNSNDN